MLESPPRPASIRQLPLSPHAARIRAPHGERDQQRGSTANMAGPFSPRPPPSVQNVPAQALSPRTVLPTPRSAALWSSHIPSRSLSPGREGSPSREDMPHDYDQMCVRPWKERAEHALLRQHEYRKGAAFSRTVLSLDDPKKSPNHRRYPSGLERAEPVQVLVTPQVKRMEEDLLQQRREIESAVRNALQRQLREVELNEKLKATLCYGCWVNLRLILSEAADNYQDDPHKSREEAFHADKDGMIEQMYQLRKLLDKFEARSEHLRTRTAFEAAALQIRQLQRQLSDSLQKSAELQTHVELLQEHLLATKAELKSEKKMRSAESELAFCRLRELEIKVQEAEIMETQRAEGAPVNDVLQQIFGKLSAAARGESTQDAKSAESLLSFLASDSGGSISLAELQEALAAFMPEPVSPADYEALVEAFKSLDADGSGRIDMLHIKEAFSDPAVLSRLSFAQWDSGSEDDGLSARSRSGASRTSRMDSAGKDPSAKSMRVSSPESEIAQLREQLESANQKHRREKAEWDKKRKELLSKTEGNGADAKPEAAGNGLAGMKKMQLVAASARDKARKSQEEVAGLFTGKKLGGKLRGVTKGLLGHHEMGGKPNFISRNASLESLESAQGPKDSPRKNEAGDDDDETDDGPTGAFDDTTAIVRRRNSKYRLLNATPAVFAQACYFDALLGRHYGRRSDVILKMMEKEFESCGISAIACRKYGGLQTTLKIEWDFALGDEYRLRAECEKFGWQVEWPNAKGASRITGKAHPQRKLMPIEHYLNHNMTKLAQLNRAEVVALRLYTGFAYGVINASLRAAAQPSSDEPTSSIDFQRSLSISRTGSGVIPRSVSRTGSGVVSRTGSGVLHRSGSAGSTMQRTWSGGSMEQLELPDPSKPTRATELLPDHSFTVTASAINSGLKKLAQLTAMPRMTCHPNAGGHRLMYRGLSGVALDDNLLLGVEDHNQDALALVILQRQVKCLDASIIGTVLSNVPGTFCPDQDPEDRDGEFSNEQVEALQNRLAAALELPAPMQAEAESMPPYSELNPDADVMSLVRALDGHMDETQLRALIAYGLKAMEQEPLTELEALSLARYSASRRARSFVETAFSSATPDLLVALEYATNDKCSTILEIETGDTDRGAWLGWISQFPSEDERTFLALSSFEVVKLRRQPRKELEEEARFQREESSLLCKFSNIQHLLFNMPSPGHDMSTQDQDANGILHEHGSPEEEERKACEAKLAEIQELIEQLGQSRQTKSAKPLRIRFQDYVNVITVRITQNTRARLSEELWLHRKMAVLDFGDKLIQEAKNDWHASSGSKIAAGLQIKLEEYAGLSAAWFESLANVNLCVQEMVGVWDAVVKRAKKDARAAVQRYLELQDDDLVNEADLFEETVKLMRTLDASNAADVNDVLPFVHASFSRLAELNQRQRGADGVIDVMCRVHDRALLDNVPADTLLMVVTSILHTALEAQPVLEVLFSEPEWRKIQQHVMPGKVRRQADETDLEAMIQYIDKHYKRATTTIIRVFELMQMMLSVPLDAGDRPGLASLRSKFADLGAIPVVVRAFSAVQDDVKGFDKPLPLHPRRLIQLGCRLLEMITSSLVVHEDSVARCEAEKITKSVLQVLDNHMGDEIVIEALLHLLIHFDFEQLQATCRLTPYNLRKLLKDASKSVEQNGQKHHTITKQAKTLVDRCGGPP